MLHRLRRIVVAVVSAVAVALSLPTTSQAAIIGSEVIDTVAGDGTYGYGGDDGPATQAQLGNPSEVAVDAAGNVYIAEPQNHRVRKVDVNGVITTVAGNGTSGYSGDGGPATQAELKGPRTLAVDAAGNLYIGTGGFFFFSNGDNRVRKVDVNGIITTVAGNGNFGSNGDGGPATQGPLAFVGGLDVDAVGNLYIAELFGERIRKVDVNGIITTVAGNGSYGFNGDGGPAVQAELDIPTDVVVDAAGNLYIADTANNRVRKVDVNGIITTIAGNGTLGSGGDGGPATQAELYRPGSLDLDAAGNLYIGSGGSLFGSGDYRVRRVDVNGIITTIAGDGTDGFGGDGGPATQAQLASSSGVAIDPDGNLYIADTVNQVVRKVTADIIDPTIDMPFTGDQELVIDDAFTIDFSCADEGTGIDTCVATLDGTPISTGHALDTSAVAEFTLIVTAVDQVGNTTEVATTITVAPPTFDISGSLFLDGDRNGELDSGEQDLSGVEVKLFAAGIDGEYETADDVLVASAVTASPYTLTGIEAGEYLLTVDTSTLPSGVFLLGNASQIVTVGTDNVTQNISTNYAQVTGTLTDPDGNPLAGVEITLADADGNTFTVTTDSDGNYTINGSAETPMALGTATITAVIDGETATSSATITNAVAQVADLQQVETEQAVTPATAQPSTAPQTASTPVASAQSTSTLPDTLAFTGTSTGTMALVALAMLVSGALLSRKRPHLPS